MTAATIASRASELLAQKVDYIAPRLFADFKLGDDDAAAIIGNLAYETDGFTDFTEDRPAIAGSRGGFGWPQWTGARRRAFEAYCKRNGLHRTSDKANYAFMFIELGGTERAALAALRKNKSLAGKVVAFEQAYERAGVKNYPARIAHAEAALATMKQRATATKEQPKMKFNILTFVGLAKVAFAALTTAIAVGIIPADNTIIAALLTIYAAFSGGTEAKRGQNGER